MKIAEIIPLFKSGCKETLSNWRPISQLSPFSKLFEKCLHSRLSKFLIKNKILNPNQFGFQANSSTENAVLKICDEICTCINNKEIVCSVFLDLKKAFDTVNHDILLKKLYMYGIRGNVYDLFASYLTNRKQYTLINGVKSDYRSISCGIPQGSVLGPLLFLLYVNDINSVSKFKINLFADDSYLSLNNHCPSQLQADMNTELLKIDRWLKMNKLSLNIEKTFFILFTNRRINFDFAIKIGTTPLKRKSEVTYLGVQLDEKMSWNPHIHRIQRKLSSAVWALSRLKNLLDQKTKVAVYYGLIHSKLLYCISCWGGVSSNKKKKLTSLQKRAMRIICNVEERSPSMPLFKELKILNLDDTYKLQIASIMNKQKQDEWRGNFAPTDIINLHNHWTRQANRQNYFVPAANIDIFKSSLSYNGPVVWRSVPDHMKRHTAVNFKKHYRDFLLKSYEAS